MPIDDLVFIQKNSASTQLENRSMRQITQETAVIGRPRKSAPAPLRTFIFMANAQTIPFVNFCGLFFKEPSSCLLYKTTPSRSETRLTGLIIEGNNSYFAFEFADFSFAVRWTFDNR